MDFLNKVSQQVNKAREQGDNQNRNQQHGQQQQQYGQQQQQYGQQQQNYDNNNYNQNQNQPSGSGGFSSHLKGFLNNATGDVEQKRRDEEKRRDDAIVEEKRKHRDQQGIFGDLKDLIDGGAEAEAKKLEAERERRRQEQANAGVFDKVSNLIAPQSSSSSQTSSKMALLNKVTGKEERKPDLIDHGIDAVQQHVFKQGSQKNEGFVEQMKDEQIRKVITGALGRK